MTFVLDPWDSPVAVSWEDDIHTKLDFYHDTYMVAGKMQTRAEVLQGNTWRLGTVTDDMALAKVVPGVGLDLRTYASAEFGGENNGASSVWLKNKAYPPTKQKPGALNEFLYSDLTVVIDFISEEPTQAQTIHGYDER